MDSVRALLKRGLPIDSGDYDGRRERPRPRRSAALLASSCRDPPPPRLRRTTLHLAAGQGNVKVVECLLAEGANPNVTDRFGQTPMQEALKSDHGHILELLRHSGGVLNFKDATAQLFAAVESGDLHRRDLRRLDVAVRPAVLPYQALTPSLGAVLDRG